MIIFIRRAKPEDSDRLMELLAQIARLHHVGRPDLFKDGRQKYGKEELTGILRDENKPIFVATNGSDDIVGYVFCIIVRYRAHANLNDHDSLYIDDFCVDENCRGGGVGKTLFQAVKAYAREIGVYSIDLNVWEFNESAIRFYESCGMRTQSRKMELIL